MKSGLKFLHDVLPNITSNYADGYCAQPSAHTPNQRKFYWDWEKDVATPALQALGFKVIRWYDGERDSFGPLSRVVELEKDGIKSTMWYG